MEGIALGDVVTISADDYGVEESRGTVVRLATDEITIRRRGPAVGEIAVHFPRTGYHIAEQ